MTGHFHEGTNPPAFAARYCEEDHRAVEDRETIATCEVTPADLRDMADDMEAGVGCKTLVTIGGEFVDLVNSED